MADDNDESWLYGESDVDKQESDVEKSLGSNTQEVNPNAEGISLEPPVIAPLQKNDQSDQLVPEENSSHSETTAIEPSELASAEDDSNQKQKEENEGELESGEITEKKKDEEDEEEEDDDNVNVVIGDIRTTPGYNANLHIKRGNLLTLTKQPGKFNVEDFESVGTINGAPAHEFNLDSLEDKPWRKPGSDITDYFNYGFNEDTWRAYCERQKRMRVHESGSGLLPMTQQNNITITGGPMMQPQIKPILINPVQSDMNAANRRGPDGQKENVIQVVTADRRDYGRKAFPHDMSVPPPVVGPPFGPMPPIQPPFIGNPYGPPPPNNDYYPEMDPYYNAYEPVQDPQWVNQEWSGPGVDVKAVNMIPMSNGTPDRPNSSANGIQDGKSKPDVLPGAVKIKSEPADDRDVERRERARDYDRDRDRERDRESRHKERSHRHRSRSRSHERERRRKHKSRSRSPSHKHKKKKKKSERTKEDSSD